MLRAGIGRAIKQRAHHVASNRRHGSIWRLTLRRTLFRFAGLCAGGLRMRATLGAIAAVVLVPVIALAAQKLAPKEIQSEFFDGKPFTAATTTGNKFKMTYAPDGKVTREPQDKAGAKGEGTWKLSKD